MNFKFPSGPFYKKTTAAQAAAPLNPSGSRLGVGLKKINRPRTPPHFHALARLSPSNLFLIKGTSSRRRPRAFPIFIAVLTDNLISLSGEARCSRGRWHREQSPRGVAGNLGSGTARGGLKGRAGGLSPPRHSGRYRGCLSHSKGID